MEKTRIKQWLKQIKTVVKNSSKIHVETYADCTKDIIMFNFFGSIFDVFFSSRTPFDLDGSRCKAITRVLEDMMTRMMATLVKKDEDEEEGHEGG